MEDRLFLRLVVSAQPPDDLGHPGSVVPTSENTHPIVHDLHINIAVADHLPCAKDLGNGCGVLAPHCHLNAKAFSTAERFVEGRDTRRCAKICHIVPSDHEFPMSREPDASLGSGAGPRRTDGIIFQNGSQSATPGRTDPNVAPVIGFGLSL
ncbi:hypothetical protein ACRAWG_25465 [Methylobacterium sp. P31]